MKNNHLTINVITASILLATPVLAVPSSDFDFYRADTNPTDFHTTAYSNGLDGNSAAAFQEFVNTEAQALDLLTIDARKLDTSKLTLNQDQEVKIYFVNEAADYANKLAIKSSGATNLNGMVFDDVSCSGNSCAYPFTLGQYTADSDSVLDLGDYVSVGNVESGSELSFELITPENTLYSDNSLNSDNQGVIAYEYEGYLVLAWEDANDGDFNDLVFALDIGQDNLNCIPSDGESLDPTCNSNPNPTVVVYPD